MRNHHEKGRDLTRSVLASTKPERARALRAQVRARERAQERRLLHDLTRAVDPDDVETPTAWIDREGLDHLVGHRRMWDNLGALLHWTRRTLATHPDLHGRGLATAVLRPGLEAADAAGWDCWLETSTPGNKAFYAGRGFTDAVPFDIPGGAPSWWLRRPA